MSLLIKNATIINEGERFKGSVIVEGERIKTVIKGDITPIQEDEADEVINAEGKFLIPGVIDDQVHFREPGLTHKADISSESMAAVAGGTTTFMDMPNTNPQTVTIDDLMWKRERAAETSSANYAFYIGANNSNIDQLKNIDRKLVCGVKVFMGSSTGNMLVDNEDMLRRIFSELDMLISTHCEKESVIKANIEKYKAIYGEDIPVSVHPLIRDEEACYASSSEAVELATKYGGRLHLLHLSTAKELTLLEDKPLSDKMITGEVCAHHLWFNDTDYAKYGTRIKWNPAIKFESDREALIKALGTDRLDVVATDHAPHLLSDKEGGALKAASGGPLIQYSLLLLFEKALQGEISLEKVVEKTSHAPAQLFKVRDRGFIKEGFYADMVIVDPRSTTKVEKESILSKCAWSPFEGYEFSNKIDTTFVNGFPVYRNGLVDTQYRGKAIEFNV